MTELAVDCGLAAAQIEDALTALVAMGTATRDPSGATTAAVAVPAFVVAITAASE